MVLESSILLQVVDQFSQHHLLKRFVFSLLYIFAFFVKYKVSIGVWIYHWAYWRIFKKDRAESWFIFLKITLENW